jgi:hypothetical protein
MFQAHEGAEGTDTRSQEIAKLIPSDVQISLLGKKLFGLESWKDEQANPMFMKC